MYNITQYDAPVLAGIQKVLARDTASILEKDSHGILLRDTVSGAYMIASDGTGWGIQCLMDHEQEKYSLLSVCADRTLTDYAAHRYGLGRVLDCYQAIYRQTEAPACISRLQVRGAGKEDLAWVRSHYDMLSEQEIASVIDRGALFIGETGGIPVGFVGEHPEGSMGLLHILHSFRGRGYGAELETYMIRRTLDQGFRPFCQVETDNLISLALQKRLGLELSREHVYWLW